MGNWWDRQLFLKERYRKVLLRLQEKASRESRILHSAPVRANLSLAWALGNESPLVSSIFKTIKTGEFEFDLHQKTHAILDKPRELLVSSWPDRIVLMVMSEILTEFLESVVSENVFSFRKGRSAFLAVSAFSRFLASRRSQTVYVIKRDISKYGESVPTRLLMEQLSKLPGLAASRFFLPLLERSLHPTFMERDQPDVQAMLLNGLPQGSPLTPPLENLYLSDLDCKLSGIPGSFYSRYGDDFVFATAQPEEAKRAEEVIDQTVRELGLEIKEEKRKNMALDLGEPKVKIVGYLISSSMEWLGYHISVTGQMGPKFAICDQTVSGLKSEIKLLAAKVGGLTANQDERAQLIERALASLLSPELNSEVSSFVTEKAGPELLSRVDRELLESLHRAISFHWRIGKRESWKVLKGIRIPSLERLHRKLLARKATRGNESHRSAA